MQSFVILCKSFWAYKADTSTETSAWDRTLTVLSVGVISTSASLGWFDLAEACWAFLQQQKFDAIVAELEQVVRMLDRRLMICKMFD